nr:trehalose-6-phosphate synthase [Actinomycetota bacterium]
ILHFTHSSFCGPKGLSRLPHPIPTSVIEGMLGADLLGFHVDPWVNGFFECCEEVGAHVDHDAGVVEHDGRRTWVRSYPIPIDADELRERAGGKEARDWANRFVQQTPGRLIVRADRAEPSKNIVRGFDAYGLLLDRRPDLSGTRFVACLYPSRQSMPEYQRHEEAIRESVARVNARHPGAIDLFLENDFDRTMGALMVYDVLVVNSIMDGMNLVSKEGASVNENGGVLVLSRGAGSFDELGADSVEIGDPLDVPATARALEDALDMPMGKRMERAERLRSIVGATKPQDWIDAQIEDLVAIKERHEPLSPSTA